MFKCTFDSLYRLYSMTAENYSTTEVFLQQIADKLAEIRNRA